LAETNQTKATPDCVLLGDAKRAESPVEWIAARDALALVMKTRSLGSPPSDWAIAKRAHAGLVQSRARLFQFETRGGYGNKQNNEKEFCDLPKEFWWAEGHEAMKADWPSGDFSTWIDKTFQWQAYGVEFAKRDIEAMIGPCAETVQVVSVAPEAPQLEGRSPSRARALEHDHPFAAAKAALQLATLDADERLRLTGPSVGKTMEQFYRDRHKRGQTPHQDNLDDFGASVLDALKQFWADGSA
jgi:hypothetical protein